MIENYENVSNVDNVIFLADVHLGVHNAKIEWVDNAKDYFDNFFVPYLSEVKKNETDGHESIVMIAGDLFEDRHLLDINVMNVAMDIIQRISQYANVYLLVGNHDIYRERDITINSLRPFNLLPGVQVIDRTTIITAFDGVKFCMIPWTASHKDETKILLANKDNADVFVMHSEISGMKMGNGRPINDGTNVKGMDQKMIYAGHIHTRQQSRNVKYLGNPFHTKREDIGNTKGIYRLHIEDGKISETFTENRYSPELIKVQLMDIIEKPLGDVVRIVDNNYVDIIVPKKYKQKINFAALTSLFEECNAKSTTVKMDATDDVAVETKKVEYGGDLTLKNVFTATLKSLDLPEDDMKKLVEMNDTYTKNAAEELNLTEVL